MGLFLSARDHERVDPAHGEVVVSRGGDEPPADGPQRDGVIAPGDRAVGEGAGRVDDGADHVGAELFGPVPVERDLPQGLAADEGECPPQRGVRGEVGAPAQEEL